MKRTVLPLLTIGLVSGDATGADAQESQELQKAAILTTISESLIVEASLIRQFDKNIIKTIEWHATFSDRDFLLTGKGVTGDGKEITMNYTGAVWGKEVIFDGTGEAGGEPVRLHGKSSWQFDKDKNTFTATDFEQLTKFGDHSFWGWCQGAEVLGVGTLGAILESGVADVATAGAAIVATPWTAGYGFIGGAATGISISKYVQQLLQSDKPPEPPPAPARPNLPQKGDKLIADNDVLYTIIDKDNLRGFQYLTATEVTVLSGKYSSSEASGVVFSGERR